MSAIELTEIISIKWNKLSSFNLTGYFLSIGNEELKKCMKKLMDFKFCKS
jgi:hypothetical protein